MRQQKAGAAKSWLENTGSESRSGYGNQINSLTQQKKNTFTEQLFQEQLPVLSLQV